ncbi:MAG: hypothetical protein H7Z39_02320 [Burkholderiaceae bacterium]|nr:hypothetical protein [Burkholderiaceae bacterium]
MMKARNGLGIAALMCAAALAQTPGADSPNAPASADTQTAVQLTPKSENGITYLCGGIGAAEAAQMKREAANYNLMLTFAESSGAYMANVSVDIADARGKPILRTVCDAPIMLLNLPTAGSYKITADVNGNPISKTVRARPGRRGASVGMTWPSGRGANPQGSLLR